VTQPTLQGLDKRGGGGDREVSEFSDDITVNCAPLV
jgi:hypothetical protein